METDNFKAHDLYALFSVFRDSDDGDIYREDLEAFIESIEENLMSRRVTRKSMMHQKCFVFDQFSMDRVNYSVRLVKDTIVASNSKVEELKTEGVTLTTRDHLLDILLKLNSDIFSNVALSD